MIPAALRIRAQKVSTLVRFCFARGLDEILGKISSPSEIHEKLMKKMQIVLEGGAKCDGRDGVFPLAGAWGGCRLQLYLCAF